MPYTANTLFIPDDSIPTYVFGSHRQSLADDPIILDPECPVDKYITLNSYRHWSKCLAAGLRQSGLKTGDRVLFLSNNDIAYPIVYMGVVMAGGIISGLSPTMNPSEVAMLAGELAPALMLTSAEGLRLAHKTAETIGLGNGKLFLFDSECLFSTTPSTPPALQVQLTDYQARHWCELLDAALAISFDWSLFISSQDQLAAIVFTSGSTDLPKGVMLSHRNVVANAVQYINQQSQDPFGPERGHIGIRVMWPPIYHTAPQNHFCVIMPKRGLKNYLMKKFEIDLLLRYTEMYRPDVLYLLPSLIVKLLAEPSLFKKYDLSSVRDVLVGGTPLRQALSERFELMMPHADCLVIQGWGMTELTCVVANQPPTDRRKTSSVGELLPNTEAMVMTQDSVEINQPNQPGELWIRSPNVAKGYWKRPEQTKAIFKSGGWIRTGDFGYFNEESHLFVIERIQDVFFPRSGTNDYVLPTDLESILLSIQGVVDAGVAVAQLSEIERVPRGFVVLSQSTKLESVLMEFNKKTPPSQRLTGGLFTLTELPRLPNSKLNRVALRNIKV